MTQLEMQGLAAKNASRVLSIAGTAKKNAALEAIASALEARREEILAANQEDMTAAKAAGMRPSLQDRLALDGSRIAGIVDGVRQVAALPDPIGEITKMSTRPNGLVIGKRRVPLGVIGIIYEARPNVTVDAAALCLKSGNAVILRGGKEAFHSNQAFVSIMRDALESAGLPRDCVALVTDTTRQSAAELMNLTEYLDVLIPRGGAGLIKNVVENAKVPVIQTGVGVCHVYVHGEADLDMAARIIHNAKTSRPSVCNAAECLLVDRAVARDFLPMAWQLLQTKNVELRGCPETSWCPPPRRTGTPSSATTFWPLRWLAASTRRWSSSTPTAPATPRPSSPTTILPPSSSWTRWTRRRCTSTPPPASPTATSSAWGRKSASPPRRCTPGAPWVWRS